MLRFVLRSENKLRQLRAALPRLRAQLPQLRVITANIQPVHMAIMEGETEIYLTDQQALAERFNDVPLWVRPQSFFQTNPTVASRLYATARDWVGQLPVRHMWDLFCGVGGFGLHCATPQMQLTGIEDRAGGDCLREAICGRAGINPPSFPGAGFHPVRHRTRRNARSGVGESSPPRHWQAVVRLPCTNGTAFYHLFKL
ncbi:RNA methyltransferase [Salmonella enterica subsp. diarizonae]|nr:RNA methyltransferase [Salmonella enterica subsp. diarizonae]